MPLVAFNVNLRTTDLRIAKKIAAAVRGSSGGLPYCKALGVAIKSQNMVQVTMNMTNYLQTPLHHAYEAIKKEAAKYEVEIAGSELIGMAPAQALADAGARYLQLEAYHYNEKVLENFF